MKRKNFVKLTAVATAAAMAISPAMVFAEDSADNVTEAGSTLEGAGNLEGVVDKNVFKVKLPTQTTGDADFTLDPQGLLKVADKDKYSLGAGAIYFKNKATTEGGTDTFSATSDAIEILNKSSFDIDVAFSVKVELPEGVTMVETEDALDSATTPSIYLAMQESDDTAKTALKAGDNSAAVKKVAGVAEDAANSPTGKGYYIAADTTGDKNSYSYKLGSGFTDTDAKKASYTLTGKCDTKADWSKVDALADDKKSVKTTIVWSAKKHTDSYLSATTMTASSNSVTLSLPDSVTLSKVELTLADGTGSITLTDGNQYTLNGSTFTIPESMITAWLGLDPSYSKVVLTYSNNNSETITLQ